MSDRHHEGRHAYGRLRGDADRDQLDDDAPWRGGETRLERAPRVPARYQGLERAYGMSGWYGALDDDAQWQRSPAGGGRVRFEPQHGRNAAASYEADADAAWYGEERWPQ